jgi:plasmid stability protein
MTNITITVPESVARWARVWAARHNTSVSRLVGELLTARMSREQAYDAAMKRHLAKPPAPLRAPGSPYPRRDELHDR